MIESLSNKQLEELLSSYTPYKLKGDISKGFAYVIIINRYRLEISYYKQYISYIISIRTNGLSKLIYVSPAFDNLTDFINSIAAYYQGNPI